MNSLESTRSSDPLFSGPHSGYHWRGQTARFFEGWYFRLTLPEVAQTFAFMYSIDDPAGGTDHSGGAVQILGPNEVYYCRTFPHPQQFWAWPHQLGLGHWRTTSSDFSDSSAPLEGSFSAQPLQPTDFAHRVTEGYQVCEELHQGRLLKPCGTVQAEWHYEITPIASWGTKTQQATAGWLSYLPVFDPGWQVLMAHGMASGWIQWQGQRYDFDAVPAYAEKNWGGTFPIKWFWLQCNAFTAMPGLSITTAGGIRDVLSWQEKVGIVGIHYQDQFYEFVSTKSPLSWRVEPWGEWRISAQTYQYRVEVVGRALDESAWVRVPTRAGLQWLCRDTTHGQLQVKLWALGDGSAGSERLIIDASSELAGLEVGGGPWDEVWCREA